MSEPTYHGPDLGDLPVWRLEMLLIMPATIVQGWADGSFPPHDQPAPDQPAPDQPTAPEPAAPPEPDQVAAVVGALPGLARPLLERFRDAVLAHEPGALAAWAQVRASAADALPRADEWMRQAFAQRAFASSLRDAPVVAALATMVGEHRRAAEAHFVGARSAFAMGDLDTTIQAYAAVLAVDDLPASLRCGAEDNLALALTNRGEGDDLDRAVQHFRAALALAESADVAISVRNNQATALTELGLYAAAVDERAAVVAALRPTDPDPARMAISLDNWAFALSDAGQLEPSLDRLVEAADAFPREALLDRCTNAIARVRVLTTLHRTPEAAAAFAEALDLAEQAVRAETDPAHFRAGLRAALYARPEPVDATMAWFVEAMQLRAAERPADAEQAFAQAAAHARESNDVLMHLRCAANVAALYSDLGAAGQAVELCRQVRGQALQLGLAAPAAMATGTLAALAADDLPVGNRPALLLAVESAVLDELNRALLDEVGVPAGHVERVAARSVGKLETTLAGIASRAGATDIAERYIRRSLDAIAGLDAPFEWLNRTASLLGMLRTRPEAAAEADALAAALEQRLAAADLPDQGRIIAHRTLAAYRGSGDPATLTHLAAAADALEALRARHTDPARREGLERTAGMSQQWVSALREAGRPGDEMLGALQRGRARRLLDELAEATGVSAGATAPDAAEVHALVAALGPDQALVEVTAVQDGLLALVVTARDTTPVHVTGDTDHLALAQWGDAEERAAAVVAAVRDSTVLVDLVGQVDALLGPDTAVLVVVDDLLANLPLHLVPVDGRAWGERRSYGRLAAAGVLRYTPADRAWRGTSLVAGDSATNLTFAAAECTDVAGLLGTRALLGAQCSAQALADGLHDTLDVVHLAVHGRADVRRGGRSSLLLATAEGGTRWTPFDELAALPFRTQVLVLSGCSTAVGGPRDGVGLYGVAQAAAEAGATTVVASLWPVDDDAAAHLMTALHRDLAALRAQGAATADLRDVLRRAVAGALAGAGPAADGAVVRSSREFQLPDGVVAGAPRAARPPDVARALRWGGFVVLGEPIVALAPAR